MSSKSKNILLVDDENDLSFIMDEILREAGHRFISATTAREGINKFKNTKNLNLAIIDLSLGNEDGLSFVKKAKTINNKVKFIMISASGWVDIKNEASQLGVKHFLDKPFKSERLLEIINHPDRM